MPTPPSVVFLFLLQIIIGSVLEAWRTADGARLGIENSAALRIDVVSL